MNIYVWKYTKEQGFQTVALIDYAISVIWIRRFQECGEFELYLPATAELFSLFLNGLTFLTKEDEIETAMKVESIQLTTDPEEGDRLIVSGRSAECILAQRNNSSGKSFDKTPIPDAIYMLLCDNFNPIDSVRNISEISYHPFDIETNETVSGIYTNQNLLEIIHTFCQASNLGIRLLFTGYGFTVELVSGTDKTEEIVFSSELENLGNTEYIYDSTGFCTTIYEGGMHNDTFVVQKAEREDEYGEVYKGLFRIERYVEAESFEVADSEAFRAELQNRAKNNLYQAKETKEFSGEIVNTEMYEFGRDYNLGDKVSIVNGYGIEGTAIVSEITETEDASGYKLIPTFSDWKVIT